MHGESRAQTITLATRKWNRRFRVEHGYVLGLGRRLRLQDLALLRDHNSLLLMFSFLIAAHKVVILKAGMQKNRNHASPFDWFRQWGLIVLPKDRMDYFIIKGKFLPHPLWEIFTNAENLRLRKRSTYVQK